MLSVDKMAGWIAQTYPETSLAHENEDSSSEFPLAEFKSHENVFLYDYQPLSVSYRE